MGRYVSCSFFDSVKNVFGNDLHLLNIPKLDKTGLSSSVFCLVNVKSKSVTIWSDCAPPFTISLRICSTLSGFFILQFSRPSVLMSLNKILLCWFELDVMMLRFDCLQNIWQMSVQLTYVDCDRTSTSRLNLYKYEAKLNSYHSTCDFIYCSDFLGLSQNR